MRAVSMMPLWEGISGMLMWHLGSEVNVTGDNGSGQGACRTLIIAVITSSSFSHSYYKEVNLNSATEQILIDTHTPILLYDAISL